MARMVYQDIAAPSAAAGRNGSVRLGGGGRAAARAAAAAARGAGARAAGGRATVRLRRGRGRSVGLAARVRAGAGLVGLLDLVRLGRGVQVLVPASTLERERGA